MTTRQKKTRKQTPLSFEDIKRVVSAHMRTAIEAEKFSITFAKLEEDDWRVNIEYAEKGAPPNWRGSALFRIDGSTGEVKEFQKGKYWTF